MDAGCWILDTGYWIFDTGFWLLEKSEIRLLIIRYWIFSIACYFWLLDTEY